MSDKKYYAFSKSGIKMGAVYAKNKIEAKKRFQSHISMLGYGEIGEIKSSKKVNLYKLWKM